MKALQDIPREILDITQDLEKIMQKLKDIRMNPALFQMNCKFAMSLECVAGTLTLCYIHLKRNISVEDMQNLIDKAIDSEVSKLKDDQGPGSTKNDPNGKAQKSKQTQIFQDAYGSKKWNPY